MYMRVYTCACVGQSIVGTRTCIYINVYAYVHCMCLCTYVHIIHVHVCATIRIVWMVVTLYIPWSVLGYTCVYSRKPIPHAYRISEDTLIDGDQSSM